ncbi:hypothetical protein M9194_05900 [Vibrio sp. S4M6]|uniref:hypothetical protein n=1 Tax=Vibrio sinus TaxID=2946865 RepID=UPI002029E6C4|nr:hypothetical protein [Vibrio sinus]MCL9780964.1 hypothetical protein [Vibrio sinus]
MSKIRAIREKQSKQYQRCDQLIRRKFSVSNMSDSKWIRLLRIASQLYSDINTIDFKLVNSEDVRRTFVEEFEEHVDEQFFREPILYKEIEWLEFPDSENSKLDVLRLKLKEKGHFPLLDTSSGLRVIGYE